MARLIDADELMESIRKALGIKSMAKSLLLPAERTIIDQIDSAPTIGEAFEAISARPERDDHFYVLLICAVRYCLGRRTYMPDLVTRWIMASVPKLPAETAKIMLQDIEEQREMGRRSGWESLGDPCDVRTWEAFESWLKERAGDA